MNPGYKKLGKKNQSLLNKTPKKKKKTIYTLDVNLQLSIASPSTCSSSRRKNLPTSGFSGMASEFKLLTLLTLTKAHAYSQHNALGSTSANDGSLLPYQGQRVEDSIDATTVTCPTVPTNGPGTTLRKCNSHQLLLQCGLPDLALMMASNISGS